MKRLAWLALYVLAILLPLIAVSVTGPEGDEDPLLLEIGNGCALIALGILLVQPVLAARIRHVERPFGLDAIYRFHRLMGVTAGALLVSHPVLVAAGVGHWGLLTTFGQPWHILLAKTALVTALVLVITALFRAALHIKFEAWRVLHNALALPLVAIGLVHSGFTAELFERPAILAVWITLGAAAVGVWTWHRVLRPVRLKARSWAVVEVKPEAHNVCMVKLEPPVGSEVPAYLPGQFHFLTLYRAGRRAEEHPFTISSSPTQGRFVTSTIKASGDFTATIPQTKPGDSAAVFGPFGRFSCALYPDEKDLVFIAGGIGVTPFMSMLRWMHDTGSDARVLLIDANRTERDIVFREELVAIERSRKPALSVAHVLNEPDASWRGERGRVDAERIRRLAGADLAGKTFYLCGPPPMMASLRATLVALGVPKSRIRSERFAL